MRTSTEQVVQIRPATYYGDGNFSPPSSDDEDDSKKPLVPPTSPGMAEMARHEQDGNGLVLGGPRARNSSYRLLVVFLIALVIFAGLIGTIAARSRTESMYRVHGAKKITMDHIFNGTFAAEKQSLHWVPEAGDGVFSISQDGHIKLVDLKTNKTSNLVTASDVKDEYGRQLSWSTWQLSADMKHILFQADREKLWRHSSYGNYYIYNTITRYTHPLIKPTTPPTVAYATWSPTGESIAYVTENDLYLLPGTSPDQKPIRITTTGSTSVFNGVPDWVYEEEIFSSPSAIWFSPDSSSMAFMTFNETLVPEFVFPVYNPSNNADTVVPYTTEVRMKYPKPGYPNPDAEIKVYDIKSGATRTCDWTPRHSLDDSVINEVAWVGNGTLLVKEVNRNADSGSVVIFDVKSRNTAANSTTLVGKVTRKLGKMGEEGDDGWIESSQNVRMVNIRNTTASGYLDIVPTPEGFNHIALFSPVDSSTPRFLTSGPWEVTDGISGVDANRGVVYFTAANPSSIARHVYSVPLTNLTVAAQMPKLLTDIPQPTALTDMKSPPPGVRVSSSGAESYYSADFSPQAGFYLLSYNGPGIPKQEIVKVGEKTFKYVLTDNKSLANVTAEFEAPVVIHSVVESDGYKLNVKEMRPPRMDDSGRTKYPVLFRLYGGPASQLVDLTYHRDFHDYIVCGRKYIVVIVDGRGTGFKGRKLRNPVKGNLGFFETKDQINVAKIWAAKEYVDRKRIGIWGWSYGGFMAAKVAEANARVHSLAMSIAPVTSWLLYDSIYTERYMNLPKLNPGGYVNASISNVTGFNHVDFLLAQGSADDNVHYANSAHLLDMFTQHKIRNFRFRMFTDSDHGISKRGAQREVYEFMLAFLIEKWGKGPRRRVW